MKHDNNISTTTLIPKRFFFLLTFFWLGCLLGSNSHVVAATAENDSMETEAKVFEEPVTYDINSLNLENSEIGEVQDGGSTGNNLFDFEAFIKNSDIVDGSAPFDDNDEAGNDSGEKNGIVRTFDTVTYPIKITINPKKVDKLENIILKITGTLENGITDNRINAKFSVGGYENLETAEVGFEQTYTIPRTGNSVMIPIAIDVQGAKNNTVLKPNFKVQVISVDGENIAEENIVTEFNQLPKFRTSGKVSIGLKLGNQTQRASDASFIPYQTLVKNVDEESFVFPVSVSFYMKPLSGRTDMKGATAPEGKINFGVDVSGKVDWDNKNIPDKTLEFTKSDTPVGLFDHIDVGVDKKVGSGSKNTLSENIVYDPYILKYQNAAQSYMTNISDYKAIEKIADRSVWDSGEYSFEKRSIEEKRITFNGSISNYMIGSTFPTRRADGYISTHYGANEKAFSTQSLLFKTPNEYKSFAKNNEINEANNVYYYINVQITSYEDSEGNVYPYNEKRSMQVYERNNPEGAYHVQTTIAGANGKNLGSYYPGATYYSHGDPTVIRGQDVLLRAHTGQGMISYGGMKAILKWNTDSFELTEEYAKQAESSLRSSSYSNYYGQSVSSPNLTSVYYGVPKFTDNSFNSLTSKTKADYDWYETYGEAVKQGSIGAIMKDTQDVIGVGRTFANGVRLKVLTTTVGSENKQGTPNITMFEAYAYTDKNRKNEVRMDRTTYNNPTLYDDLGKLAKIQSPVGSTVSFETLGIMNAEVSNEITADKSTYYNSDEINWTAKTAMLLPVGGVDSFDGSVEIKQILPKGLDYKPNSGKQGNLTKEPKIIKNSDGTTTLLWEILVSEKSPEIGDITFTTTINPFALSSGVQNSITVKNIVSSYLDAREESLRTSTQTLTILKVGMVGIYESIDTDYGEKNSSFTIRMKPYTTIEEEHDVKGITILPFNDDELGTSYGGEVFLDGVSKSGDNPVSIYLNNQVIHTDRPHEVDLSKNGWYKYTGKDQDISQAKTMLFHIEGVLTNEDVVEISMTIQTRDNNFGNVYYNETTINSATDYKLSPVSNKVKYSIRADAELNLERIQIYTANAREFLPVKVRINKEVIKDSALDETLKLSLYEQETNKKVFEKVFSIGGLERENQIEVPSDYLETNTNKSYEVRVEGYNTNRIYVKEGADKLNTIGYTASEETIEKQSEDGEEIQYKGVVMTEREIGKEIVSYYETVVVPLKKNRTIKSGYGLEMNQQIKYKNDLGISKIEIPNLAVYLNSDAVDGDFYNNQSGEVKVDLLHEELVVGDTLVQTLKYPKVFIEEVDGTVFSEQQVNEQHESINHNVVDGGNKVYVPIWIESLGEYKYQLKNEEPIGVNEINVIVNDTINVEAYMYGHIGSETIENDEILIVPVDLANPFPNGLPDGWTESDLEWLQGN